MSIDTQSVNQVLLSQKSINGKPFLQFDFNGHLNLETAIEAIAKWKAQLQDGKK